VSHQVGRTLAPSEIDAECFGRISATTSRNLSHNDKWIIAASIMGGHCLLIEDTRIHMQVMRNAEFAQAVVNSGSSNPQIVLVASARAME
jgi:hypothetical protein